jgi:hypothetical protein
VVHENRDPGVLGCFSLPIAATPHSEHWPDINAKPRLWLWPGSLRGLGVTRQLANTTTNRVVSVL